MKYALYAIALISFIWGAIVNSGFNSTSMLLATSYTSVFWGVALIYLYDFLMAEAGRNSPYMAEFYSSLRADLLVSCVIGFTLALLFWNAPNTYSWSNIDLAAIGLPFLVYALNDTIQSGRIKIGGNKLPRKIVSIMAFIQIITYGLSMYCLSYILSGKASSSQSVWIQLTIVSAALTFFFGAKQIRFILTKQRLEVSPVLLNLFQSIPASPLLYKELQSGADLWNAEIKKSNATKRKLSNSSRSKKKRK